METENRARSKGYKATTAKTLKLHNFKNNLFEKPIKITLTSKTLKKMLVFAWLTQVSVK